MIKYGYLVKCEIKDAEFKYGFKQQGTFAAENIKKGQKIFRCSPNECDYITENKCYKLTIDEVQEMCKKNPDKKDFIIYYSTMFDDDCYVIPSNFNADKICKCSKINHSCDPNITFSSEYHVCYMAKRDIECGEEFTFDYQLMDTDASLYDINCKCGSHKCRGKLRLSEYRNIDWITENKEDATFYVQRRIDELKTKWFSTSCCIRKKNNKTELGLTALRKISKSELVAVFADPNNITREAHYIRHSDNPSCYVDKTTGRVFAINNIEPSTELTISYDE